MEIEAKNPKKGTEKEQVKCTASSMGVYPPEKQARGIAYCKKHNHIAVSNNYGLISLRDFEDFDK